MTTLIERFSGVENRPRLIDALRRQKIIAGDHALAEQFAEKGHLKELVVGDILIKEGDWDDDLFCILAGEVEATIRGQSVQKRIFGEHVGELTGINPARARTATVTATQQSLVLQISMADIKEVGKDNVEFWQRFADGVAEQLDVRNQKIGKINDVPRVFVISSSEGKHVMTEIFRQLNSKEILVDTWDDGTFGISEYPISSLMDRIEASDFTVSIVRPDDILISRGKTHMVARDNVHLEYGMSLGTLGRRRSVLLVCATDDTKLPSDTSGLNTLRYTEDDKDDLRRSIKKFTIEMRELIELEGVFKERRA